MASNPFVLVDIRACEILDSRGRPTVEAHVTLDCGCNGMAAIPSGASTGRHEAHELRDGDPARHDGRGVRRAVANVSGEICSALIGQDVRDQAAIDARLVTLDGSPALERLGANAVLAASLAACRAAAAAEGVALYRYINRLVPERQPTMPMPMVNILSGGAHAGRGMDIQDFLVIPVGAATYEDALLMVSRIRTEAGELCARRGITRLLADEGGLSPGFADPREALDLVMESIVAAGCEPGRDAAIALDIAATELFAEGNYRLERMDRTLPPADMATFIAGLVRDYPIISVEDPLAEDDWSNWQALTAGLRHIQLLGDDLFVTSPERIARGVEEGVANAALIKLNQNGTLSGTLHAMRTAWDAGYATVVSARSGETEDSFIADLAVGTGAGQIKIGSLRNSERLSKYNQLLRIDALEQLPFARDALFRKAG